MDIRIRRGNPKDAGKIAEYAYKLAIQHRDYDPGRFSVFASLEQMIDFYGRQAAAKDSVILIAEFERKVVGFAYIQFEAKDYPNLLENAAWLHDIYIDEALRGKDAGRRLIEASIISAKELGAEKLMLSAASQNEFARGFFERNGFKTTMVEMMFSLT
jgi:GNAT superfamily N-acetyltransferase